MKNDIEMTPEERTYSKKPKSILVLDCVYLSGERRKLEKQLQEFRYEVDRSRDKIVNLKGKNLQLQEALSHSLKTSESLRLATRHE